MQTKQETEISPDTGGNYQHSRTPTYHRRNIIEFGFQEYYGFSINQQILQGLSGQSHVLAQEMEIERFVNEESGRLDQGNPNDKGY